MSSGNGRILILVVGTLALMVPGIPPHASAQVLAVGGQVPVNRNVAEDHIWGIGVRGQLRLPLTGITLQGTADLYSPDCGAPDCDFRQVSLNLLWSFPLLYFVKPYFGAGVAVQSREGGWSVEEAEDRGINFLAGMLLQGSSFQRFQPFVEAKYQAMREFGSQTVIAGGILLRIF